MRLLGVLFAGVASIMSCNASVALDNNMGSRHRGAQPGVVRASYYGGGSSERLSRHTASGEVFHPNGMTAASMRYPLGTKLLVTHECKSVVVREIGRAHV